MFVKSAAISAGVDSSLSAVRPARRYVRSAHFDSTLVTAPALAGLTAGVAATVFPLVFPVLLVADIWLLGYHHVLAMYTRLAFSRDSLRQHRFLAIDLLLMVLVASVATALWYGTWLIVSAFLYLQWFHYMRQGYGIARMYYRATPEGRSTGRDWVADLVLYLVPVYGIAHRSATMGDQFLWLPVKTIVLPDVLVGTLGVAAAAAVAVWWVRTGRAIVRGDVNTHYAAFVLSHVVIFLTAYVAIDDVNVGWLAINIWHNLQYVLVVWMVNAKRYAGGIDPKARFISAISQPNRIVAYFASCVGIATIVYFNLNLVTSALFGSGLAATFGIYMGINFHHYAVDAVIWKRRRMSATAPV
ncbi:MAG: hypothetical protein ACRD3C_19015 [Vicinamibacterales bacterium]